MRSPAETEDRHPRETATRTGGRARAGTTWLRTSDGVLIEAEHLPAADGSGHLGIVLAHGFTGSLDRPAVRRAAHRLTRSGGVVTFSFRGHGGSGGRSTVGDREVLDLDAAVRWARLLGYARIATVGFSMGGSVVLRQAGGGGAAPVDAVVSVSSPARWYYRGTAPMRRLHWAVTRPMGRAVSRVGLRTRVEARGWDPVPCSPVEAVPLIAPAPLLIVHGDSDGYFPLDHPLSLAEAAGEGAAELWIERGFGHAENAAGPELLDRVGQWLTSRVPAPDEEPAAVPGPGGRPAALPGGRADAP
ncbi:alpha/beta hydrolase family protein [Actinacidiphila yeochonensis]|uniref:alpha/beta hydrolase family protein n=1 Tax=Actinacidiphila yeochonensis TaxID=89050 RepID=UPI000AC451E9|nr:alpha/beta fold hydrolase [Actinacidiphila yeochonensis]